MAGAHSHSHPHTVRELNGAGEMTQWLRALVDLSREPEFDSQHPCVSSQPCVTPDPKFQGIRLPGAPGIGMVRIQTHRQDSHMESK